MSLHGILGTTVLCAAWLWVYGASRFCTSKLYCAAREDQPCSCHRHLLVPVDIQLQIVWGGGQQCDSVASFPRGITTEEAALSVFRSQLLVQNCFWPFPIYVCALLRLGLAFIIASNVAKRYSLVGLLSCPYVQREAPPPVIFYRIHLGTEHLKLLYLGTLPC